MMQQPQPRNMLTGETGGGGASPDSSTNRKTRKKRAQKLRSKKRAQAAAAAAAIVAVPPDVIAPPPAAMSASVSITSSQPSTSSSVSVSFFRRKLAGLASVTRNKRETILGKEKAPVNRTVPGKSVPRKMNSKSSSKKGLTAIPDESPTLLGIEPQQSPFLAGAAQTLSSTIHACFHDDDKNKTETTKTNAVIDHSSSPSGTGSMTSSSGSQSQDFLLGIQQCFYQQHQEHEQNRQVEHGIPSTVPSCHAEGETEIVFSDDEDISLDKQHAHQQQVEQCRIPSTVPANHAEEETEIVFSDDDSMSLDIGSAHLFSEQLPNNEENIEEEEESVFKSAWSVNTSARRNSEFPPVMSVSIPTSRSVAAHPQVVNDDDEHFTSENIETPMNADIEPEPMMTPTLFPFNNDPAVEEEVQPLRSDYGPINEKKKMKNEPPAATKSRLATPAEVSSFLNKKTMDQDGPEPPPLDNDYGPTREKKRVRKVRDLTTRTPEKCQPPAAAKFRLATPPPTEVLPSFQNRKPMVQDGPEQLPLDNDYGPIHDKKRMRKVSHHTTRASDKRQPLAAAQSRLVTPAEQPPLFENNNPMVQDGPESLPSDQAEKLNVNLNNVMIHALHVKPAGKGRAQRKVQPRIDEYEQAAAKSQAKVQARIDEYEKVAAKSPAKRKTKARLTESRFWTKPADKTPERAPGAKDPLPSHKVYLMLLQPESKKFELIVLRYTVATTTIGDILDLIPANATEAVLGSQRYTGLAQSTAPGKSSKSNSSAPSWTDLTLLASSSWKNQKDSANIGNGDILVAIPDGYTSTYVTGISKYILKNPRIQELLGRATLDPTPAPVSPADKVASVKSGVTKDESIRSSAKRSEIKKSSNRKEKRRSVRDEDGDDDTASGTGGSKRSRSHQHESVSSMDSFLPQVAKEDYQSLGDTTPKVYNDHGVPRALFNMAITTSPTSSSTATFEKNLQKQKNENPFQPVGHAVEFVFNAPAPVATGQGVLYNYTKEPSYPRRFVPKDRHGQLSSWSQSFNHSVSSGHSLTTSTKRKRRQKFMKKMKLGCLAVVSLMVLRYVLDPLGYAARGAPAVAADSSMGLATFMCCFAFFIALAKVQMFLQTNVNPSESKCIFMQSSASLWDRLQQRQATATTGVGR
jgi:hypothetical protein